VPSLVPDRWFILRFSHAAHEDVVARYGSVEIRRTEGGLSAETRVKGEREQACATALCRLRQFLSRNFRSGIPLRLRRPLVQFEEAPGRWSVHIGLSGSPDNIMSPASRGGRVRVRAVEPETVAVVGLRGRVTAGAVEHGAATIIESLATTPWKVTGKPMVRLQTPGSILPFVGRFEVAMPVAGRQVALSGLSTFSAVNPSNPAPAPPSSR
jgi:hypothetical protein